MKSKSKQFDSSKPVSLTNSPFLSPGFQRTQDNSSMDWSTNPAPVSPPPYTPPTEVCMSLPHVPLPYMGSRDNSRLELNSSDTKLLDYDNNQPSDKSSWNGVFQTVLLFGTKKTISNDATNIHASLVRISKYIKNCLINRVSLGNEFIPVVRSL